MLQVRCWVCHGTHAVLAGPLVLYGKKRFFLTPPPNCIATSMQHCLLAMSQGCQNVTMLDSQTMASIPRAKHHHQIQDSKCTETGASKGPGLALPLQKRERLLAASHPSVCHLCACLFCKTKRVSLLGAGQFSTHPANSVGNRSSPPHLLWAMSSQEAVLQKPKNDHQITFKNQPVLGTTHRPRR